jgi:aminopeptidase
MSYGANFDQLLTKYAEVIVKVGVNIQPGQELFIGSPAMGNGTSFEVATLVRKITQIAYQEGASLVHVLWDDDEITKIRMQYADPSTLDKFEKWRADAMIACVENDGAVMRIYSNAPDTFSAMDPDVVAKMQGVSTQHMIPYREAIGKYQPSWLVTAAANPAWAKMIMPDLPEDQATAKLWEVIFKTCRATEDDPIAAWQTHRDMVEARGKYMTDKGYTAIRYYGPGTDLTVGLPNNHIWAGGGSVNKHGIPFVANIPTEEIFTTPHKDRVNGTVTATMPLSYSGTIIDDFSLTFKDGVVVDFKAGKGHKILSEMLKRDEGASRLGEAAIVPHSSPISQSGLLFYNTLYDENAACHIALGNAYRVGIKNTNEVSKEEFAALGGNHSMIHVDFMIGSDKVNIDGICADGSTEPVLRNGEWAFEV